MSFHSFSTNKISIYIVMTCRLELYDRFDEKAPVTCTIFKKPIFLLDFRIIITADLRMIYLMKYTSVLHEQAQIMTVRVHTIWIKYLVGPHLPTTSTTVRYPTPIWFIRIGVYLRCSTSVYTYRWSTYANNWLMFIDLSIYIHTWSKKGMETNQNNHLHKYNKNLLFRIQIRISVYVGFWLALE